MSELIVQELIHNLRNAPSGLGPMAGTWADKPHRLIYDAADALAAQAAEIERLTARAAAAEAEAERLRGLLAECADDLAEHVEAAYPASTRNYPSEARRYARDMEPVIRARAALAKTEGEP